MEEKDRGAETQRDAAPKQTQGPLQRKEVERARVHDLDEWRRWPVDVLLSALVTWDRLVRSPTYAALESAPSQCLGLAGRAECSGAVLARPFK